MAETRNPIKYFASQFFFILFALPHQHQFSETAPESSHGK